MAAGKASRALRIAALGDSFAVGPAVAYRNNFLTLLEKELPGTEVYNFGVSGTGPREYRLILHQDGWRCRPDLILVCVFVGNDITEQMATPRHFDPRQSALYLFLRRGWRLARERLRNRPAESQVEQASGRGPAGLSEAAFREVEARRLIVCAKEPKEAFEKKWRRALDDLQGIIEDCRRHQTPVRFVLMPDEFQVNAQVFEQALLDSGLVRGELDLALPQERLREFFGREGVPCLDLLPAFQKESDTYAPRDTHWNEKGNRLASKWIAGWLQAQDDCRRAASASSRK